MSPKFTTSSIRLGAICLVMGAAGLAAGTVYAQNGDGNLSCEIKATKQSGMISIEALATAKQSASGTYRFEISGGSNGGSSTIRQGGEFSAGTGETATLGQVTLGANGARYDAKLTINAGGKALTCSERIS
jgi:hypothetical protein